MDNTNRILDALGHPSEEFTPIPFWFFDDEPDAGKIEAQLKDYVEKGVNGIVLHPRIGVPENIPYLSDAFFAAVRMIVETAARLKMKIVLYDEGMYPSGSAHGMVVAANPDFAAKGIVLVDAGEDGEAAQGMCTAEINSAGQDTSATASSRENASDEQQDHSEISAEQNTHKNVCDNGEQLIVALPDGRRLVYRPTGGTIRGIHFGEDDGEAGAPAAADILNPDAVALFIHLTHDRYYQELKDYFGNTIIGFFTDEPDPRGRNAGQYRAWAAGMEKEIEAQGGKLEELAAMFDGKENASTRIYHRLIKKHLRETFYAPLSRWCETHGIAFMGHPAESDDVEEELYFHIPGQDLIMRRVAPETGGLLESDSVQAKLAADIARHLGRRRNANECLGVCNRHNIPWYLPASDVKWYLSWLGFRGVNMYVLHAFYYSVVGRRKDERPPDVGPNNIWWPYYRQFTDYIKRISWLMTDSANGARIAVLCDNNRVPYRELAFLYENQIDFNYLTAAMLPECELRDGKLCLRGYAYDAVLDVIGAGRDGRTGAAGKVGQETEARKTIGPRADEAGVQTDGKTVASETEQAVGLSQRIAWYESEDALRAALFGGELDALRSAGAQVQWAGKIVCGSFDENAVLAEAGFIAEEPETRTETPAAAGTSENMEKPQAAAAEGAQAAATEKQPTIALHQTGETAALVRITRLEKDGAQMYLLANEGTEDLAACVSVPGTVGIVLADLWTDARRKPALVDNCGRTAFAVQLRPGEMQLALVCDAAEREIEGEAAHRKSSLAGDLTDNFQLISEEENRKVYALDYEYTGRTQAADGSAGMAADANATGICFTVRGEEMAECYCNGSFAGVSFTSPHCFTLADCLQPGKNHIELRFTGSAANIYEHADIPFGLGTALQ